MGTFKEKILISSAEKPELKTELECVVDTGATYTWIPQDVLSELEIARKFTRKFKIADGSTIERAMSWILVTYKNQTVPTLVAFGDTQSEPLLGAVTLEELGLTVDPVSKNLIPAVGYMLGIFPEK
jgi:predicted aspartyl protease